MARKKTTEENTKVKASSKLKRQGTMDATSEEAKKILERSSRTSGKRKAPSARNEHIAASSNKEKPVSTKRVRTETPVSPKKSPLKRGKTMIATAKEGKAFVEKSLPSRKKDATTKSTEKKKNQSATKLKRGHTMIETAKEGENFLAGH